MPKKSPNPRPIQPCAWAVNDWLASTGIGRTKLYELIDEGRIQSVKFGHKRLIVTPPAAFIASLQQQAA